MALHSEYTFFFENYALIIMRLLVYMLSSDLFLTSFTNYTNFYITYGVVNPVKVFFGGR